MNLFQKKTIGLTGTFIFQDFGDFVDSDKISILNDKEFENEKQIYENFINSKLDFTNSSN